MVPIAKMIMMQPERYGAFAKFPLGTKVFVNACINFVEAVNLYKTKVGPFCLPKTKSLCVYADVLQH